MGGDARQYGIGVLANVLSGACAVLFMVTLLVLSAPMPAYADSDSMGLPDDASGSSAAIAGSGASAASARLDAAIASCLAGLLEGWDVPDSGSLYGSAMLDVADGTCVWVAFDAYRAGMTEDAGEFLARMEDYTTQAYASDDAGLDPYSPTTWGRDAIVVGTLGADPTAFGRTPAGTAANLLSDGLYNWAYTDDLGTQGSNAYIYALQALDALDVQVPADAAYSAQDMIDSLLACQAEDGSFGLSPGSATGSVDLTGMALAALSAYRDDPQVEQAIERGIAYLAEQQQPSGGFAAEGEETSESCAMVIIGLAACGVDPSSDARFMQEGGSVLDALLAFQKTNGTFGHTADDMADADVQDLPTEQALRALLALKDLQQGGDGNVYTADTALQIAGLAEAFGGAPGAEGESAAASDWGTRLASMGIGAAAALVVVVLIWAVRRIRRRSRR